MKHFLRWALVVLASIALDQAIAHWRGASPHGLVPHRDGDVWAAELLAAGECLDASRFVRTERQRLGSLSDSDAELLLTQLASARPRRVCAAALTESGDERVARAVIVELDAGDRGGVRTAHARWLGAGDPVEDGYAAWGRRYYVIVPTR